MNCLWKNGVQDDILYLVYLLNITYITLKTPFGDTAPFVTES